MESVLSSMESVGAMDLYEEAYSVKAHMGVMNSDTVTKNELCKELLELESNLEDHINGIHDCQQDPDNLEVNEVCMGKEEEEEEDEGNASKVDEGDSGIADVWNDEDGETAAKTGVHEQTQPTFVDIKRAKQDGGNSSKSMTKIWCDIPSNEDGDIIEKIDEVPEQAQRTTGPDVPGRVIRMSNLKSGKGSVIPCNEDRNIIEKIDGVPKQAQRTTGPGTPSVIPGNEDRNIIEKIDGVPEQAQRTTGPGIADVWIGVGGETTGKTERVHEQAQPTSDDVRLAQKDAGNSSKINEESMTKMLNDKRVGEEEEKGEGNTPKIKEDFKTSTDYNGTSDSEQDADNSPSWWDGTNIWQILSWGFRLILLICIMTPAVAFANPASNPHKYSPNTGSTQMEDNLTCGHYLSELYNHSGPFEDRNLCIKEQKNIQCALGLESMCILYINQDVFYSGCGKRGLLLNGTECPMVTHQNETNKYFVQCYPNECLKCKDSDSQEQRLSKCRDLQNKKSSSTCTRKEPYLWIMVSMIVVACVFTR